MGFYGNITNIARTQFQFDKIYPNRYEMEKQTLTDGIYAGRHVLIEYDQNIQTDTMTRVWKKGNNFYTANSTDIKYLLTKGNTTKNTVVFTANTDNIIQNGIYDLQICAFYICTSELVDGSTEPAIFREVVNGSNDMPAYTINYNIDTEIFGAGRGYDSTVWQKIYGSDTGEKYVMIAELNTVVPTFEVVADAPTMNPVVPHFDTQSTDVYYKLHMQAPWGFRIAEAGAEKSDGKTDWTITTYNPETGRNEVSTASNIDAAIYFNKDAFEAQVGSATIKKKDTVTDNEIKVTPVSSQQAIYDDHDPATKNLVSAPDIQEMTINLPAIGNMMSDAWDIIHGPNRDDARTDENSSLQGRLDSFKDMSGNQIPVKRNDDGTLVGTNINGNTPRIVTNIKEEELHINDKTQDDAWIKTGIDTSRLTDANNSSNNGISIHHTFTSTPDTTSTSNKNTDNVASENASDKIELYTPYVDAAGHVVGKNVETVTLPYGFKTIKTNGRGTSATENATSTPVIPDVVADNTQDELAINSGNKWIRIDSDEDSLTFSHDVHNITATESNVDCNNAINNKGDTGLNVNIKALDAIILQSIDYDAAGHITSSNTETVTLPFGFKTIAATNTKNSVVDAPVEDVTAAIVADTTQDTLTISASNKWIKLGTNTEDTVKFGHLLKDVTNTTSEATLSNEKSTPVTFYIPIDSFDEAGHHSGRDVKTITMPFGYGKIKGDEGNTEATATYDELTFASDDWLTATVEKDKITYSHDYPVTGTAQDKSEATPSFGGTFTIDDHYFDDKGHKFASKTHTVKIPLPSLVNGTGNVCTGLALEPASGKFTESKANVGTLNLTGYETLTSVSNGALSAADTINGAFGKLEYRIAQEVSDRKAAIDNLDVSDTVDNAKFVSGVSQTDGKITVSRAGTDALTLSSYSQGNNVSVVADKDTINTAFAKLQNQIDAIKGSGDIAENFDSIKEIADWLKANDSNADAVIDSIATLSGDESTVGSVSNKIKNSIDALDVTDAVKAGEYVSAVSETDGKISVSRATLPTYTLTTGNENGTVAFNNTDVAVKGLGSAAYTSSDAYAKSNILDTTFKFTADAAYKPEANADVTIANLVTIVANLQAEIEALKKANT